MPETDGSETGGSGPLRAMTTDDVPAVLAVQEPGAVLGLSEVFPQDAYPFPRDEVARRWREEITTGDVDCFVVVTDDVVVGFAAIRGDEFLHFGIAVEHWGDGTARFAHDAVLDLLGGRVSTVRGSGSSRGTHEVAGSTRSSAGSERVPPPTARSRRMPSSCATSARSHP